jgi:hypothetical protein
MLPDLFRLIGSDRYLSSEEVDRAAAPHPATAQAWDVYAAQFQGFTGATIDPDFHRLLHPASLTGRLRLEPDTTVLVAGTGASLLTQIDAIKSVRGRLRIFTSAEGADFLAAHGITADLVMIEQTPAAARHAARQARDTSRPVWLGKDHPLVAATWRTPAALLSGVSPQHLFVPASTATWGLWQATAVALAAEARASRIALVGVDTVDAEDASLKALLELIARLAPIVAFDCGGHRSAKRGWVSASVEESAGTKVKGPLEANLWTAPTVDERLHDAHADLAELAPTLNRARRLLAVVREARVMGDAAPAAALEAAADEMMSWRHEPRVRTLVQECLGGSFLPRLWRKGLDDSSGRTLVRPLQLAMREVVGGADALAAAIKLSHAA